MKRQRRAGELSAVLLACGLVLALAGPAGAKRDFLERYQAYFGLKETGKCVFCHDVKEKEKPGKKNLGLYGRDVQQLMNSNAEFKINVQFAAVKLFDKDSDSDGASNMEEMALNTFPGDARSIPQKEALEKYRKQVAEVKAAKEGKGKPVSDTKKAPAGKK